MDDQMVKLELSQPNLTDKLKCDLNGILEKGLTSETIILRSLQMVIRLGQEKKMDGLLKKNILITTMKEALSTVPEGERALLEAIIDKALPTAIPSIIWIYKEGVARSQSSLKRFLKCASE